MKKLLSFLISFLFFYILSTLSVFADVVPRYSDNIRYTGIGAFNVPEKFIIYSEPDENSKVIATVKWDEKGLFDTSIKEQDIFISFLPKQGIAYCSVDEEIEGWVKIFYSQSLGKSGWVKATPKNRYVSWLGFYMSWGRKNGVYFFKDMPDINKRLMSAPDANSQKLWGITYPKIIKMTLVRGNWMMVKLVDFGNEAKIGWIQWRDENGRFLIFPYVER